MKVKGIGPVLAAVFVVEIGDITRFGTADQLDCWASITPRHYASDRTIRRATSARKAALWSAGPDSRPCSVVATSGREGQDRYRGSPRSGGSQHAKVAAARKMLEVVFCVLRNGQPRCLVAAPAAETAA